MARLRVMSTLSYTLFRQSAIDKRTILMAFSRMLEKLWVLEREYREGTNHVGVRVERNPDFEKVSDLFSRAGKTLTLLVPECD